MNKTTKTVTGGAGIPYGHVPGHQFHDVDCELRQRGCAVGLHPDGRNVYRGAGETPDDACRPTNSAPSRKPLAGSARSSCAGR